MSKLHLLPCLGISALLLFSGCASSRSIQEEPTPSWVTARPISPSHYIGIGSASPNPVPGEALRSAKERAAADLAGEISLRVESASLLESEEKNGHVKEEFTSTITSRSEERIAGFEVIDVWEGASGCHVYYRLNKAKHAAARKARQAEAIASAMDELEAGESDLKSGRIPSALNHWSTGVLNLEEFWNEVNQAEHQRKTISLEPHLIRRMRDVLRTIELEPALEQVVLEADNHFKFPLGIHATHEGEFAPSIPIEYQYHNGTYRKKATEFTDDEGVLVALIEGVSPNRPNPNFTASVDLNRLFKSASIPTIVSELVGDINTSNVRLPIRVEMPSFQLAPSPNTGLNAADHAPLIQALRTVLLDEGFSVHSATEAADYQIEFDLRVERRTPSGDFGNFHTAYITGAISLKTFEGRLLKEVALDRVKGVQLDPQAAFQLALSNAAEAIEKNQGLELIRSIH